MLTDKEIGNFKEPGKYADQRGLFLKVEPSGSKLWRYKYRFQGKERLLALGVYPEVSLKDARRKHEDARRLLDNKTDPAAQRRQEKVNAKVAEGNTFGVVARDYMDKLVGLGRHERTIVKNEWKLFKLCAPLQDRPITEITAHELLYLLKRIEKSGRRETARVVRSTIGSVFAHAISTLRAETNPIESLRRALLPPIVTPRAAITEEVSFGRLLTTIDEYDGWPTLTGLLKFTALTFQRPGETRFVEWSDIEGAVWHIAANKMKGGRFAHEVPLSRQVLAVLDDIRPLSGDSKFVFPSIRSDEKVLSENAMNAALRRIGYGKNEHTAHGFRASASTILNSRKIYRDVVIEKQLAHLDPNKVRATYNRWQYWDEREVLMQDWADICDSLKRPKRDNSDLI